MAKKRLIVVALVAVIVVGIIVGFKILTSPGSPAVPEHLTIAQVRQDMSGRVIKVGGDVAPGSIGWDQATRSLRFTLIGGGDALPVVYQGLAPDDFRPGLPLVVEGTYSNSGIFEATSLTTPGSSPLCKACHG